MEGEQEIVPVDVEEERIGRGGLGVVNRKGKRSGAPSAQTKQGKYKRMGCTNETGTLIKKRRVCTKSVGKEGW